MIVAAWWRKLRWCAEDIIEFDEGGHDVSCRHCVGRQHLTPRRYALPDGAVVIPPATHAAISKILEDGAERTVPLYPQRHFVARLRNDKEVHNELLVDAKPNILANASARDHVVVGHHHLEARAMNWQEVEVICSGHGDEGVCGP
jgi:hypothetical protein